jgi:glutathione S-transferase
MIRLYDYELSSNCYKLRLLLGLLNVPYERVAIDFHPGREHKAPWFLEINPLGQIPVIDDDGFILRDAQAILAYLATKYDRTGRWYPRGTPEAIGKMSMWLAFADSLTATASAARLHDTFFFDFDAETCRKAAHALFRVLEEHLWFAEAQSEDWILGGDHPTIADIACFPCVMLSEEGGISRLPYPAIRRWTDRVKRLPSFSVMPGIFPI